MDSYYAWNENGNGKRKLNLIEAPINPLAYVHVHTGLKRNLKPIGRWMNWTWAYLLEPILSSRDWTALARTERSHCRTETEIDAELEMTGMNWLSRNNCGISLSSIVSKLVDGYHTAHTRTPLCRFFEKLKLTFEKMVSKRTPFQIRFHPYTSPSIAALDIACGCLREVTKLILKLILYNYS